MLRYPFSKETHKDAQELARKGEVCGVFSAFIVWAKF